MTVAVADAAADDREAWPEGVQEWPARGSGAAMVGYLEQIPAASLGPDPLHQLEVLVLLEVAGEQGALAPQAHA